MTPERAADAGHLRLVLDLGDGWRGWRITPQGARPGTLGLPSALGASFPRCTPSVRSGLITRPDGLVAAGFCFARPETIPRFQGALPEAPREGVRRAWIWLSWEDWNPIDEAMADLLARARAEMHAGDRPAFWSQHARLAHAARVDALLPAVAAAAPVWNAPCA